VCVKIYIIQVAYPTPWPLQTTFLNGQVGDELLTNYVLAARLSMLLTFKYIEVAPDRHSWAQTPLSINADYSPESNGLFIPAGILQGPFFDSTSPAARNCGSIGCILGHEMSHALDDEGRRFDSHGIMRWMQPQSIANFDARQECLKMLYSSYKVDGINVNGNLTIGESTADYAGVKAAYEALTASSTTPSARRLFFTSFAQLYCEDSRAKAVKEALLTDPHAPARYRVIGTLSQFPPFAEAFECTAGSPMAPLHPCSFW
jgi:endothelin-converting enzyme